MQTFLNRLILQKRVYFLQEFGIPFDYSFGWYISGPYASGLADDGFENEPISKLFYQKRDKYSKYLPKVKNADKKPLHRARKFFDIIAESKIPEGRFLELASSLHFLKTNWFPNDDYSRGAKALKKLKPGKFSEEEIKEAQDLLRKFF